MKHSWTKRRYTRCLSPLERERIRPNPFVVTKRQHCVKCGATLALVNLAPERVSYGRWRYMVRYFTLLGGAHQRIDHMPPCEGLSNYEAPVGA